MTEDELLLLRQHFPARYWAQRFPELANPADGAARACRVCGVRRRTRDAEQEWVQDVDLIPAGPPEQPWRWRHARCEPSWSSVLRQVLGLELAEEVARHAAEHSGVAVLGRFANVVSRKPFGHLGVEQLEQLRRSVGRELAKVSPRRSTQGRCGLCGASRSLRWHRVAFLQWADGSTALACDACEPVLRLVDTAEDEGVPIAALAAMAGLRPGRELRTLATTAMRPFVALATAEARQEDGHTPWDYGTAALADVRREAYRRHPELLRDEGKRQLYLKIQALHRARAEREAAERELEATPGGGLW